MCLLMPRMYEVSEAEHFNPLEGTLYCDISLDPQTSDQKSVRINVTQPRFEQAGHLVKNRSEGLHFEIPNNSEHFIPKYKQMHS